MLSKTIALLCGLLLIVEAALACGPGRAGGRRIFNRMRNYPPLVQRQYIPNVSENTFGASGAPEGPIRRHDQRFKELVQNWNPDIEFRDDERTGADRMMSQRLKEKLSVLAISVMNQWPNVRLRVIEGWDEDRRHSTNSLHYEGRAVDITTSDKDRSKYGMLARLAVEAGFDWVHYESRSHVHCSVKSEKADAIRNNGCFDGESLVETPMGQMEMSQLQTNDLVMTMNPRSGELQFSPVLMWLDRDELGEELYVNITTKSGKQIRLTSSHLIYLADEPLPKMALTPTTDSLTTSVNTLDLNDTHNNTTTMPAKDKTSASPRANDESNGGNLYYYELFEAGNGNGESNRLQEAAAASSQSGDNNLATSASKLATSERNQTTTKSKRDDRQTIAPAAANSLPSPQFGAPTRPANEPRAQELSHFIYTTYARNAIVGQYLLIHKPEEQMKFVGSHGTNSESGFRVLRPRSSGPNRLVLDPELETSRYTRLSFKSARNKNTNLTPRTKVMFDEIVGVNYVSRHGIYAPLTRDGNIVVNSVVASCYAVISDHDMAHLSMAPVRWISSLYEKLFGLRPETPTYERTVDSVRRRDQLDGRIEKRVENSRDHLGTTSSLSRIKAATRHVHWYPILLYNIARYVLPNNYLY